MGTLAKRAHSLKEYSCCETEVSHPTRLTIDLEGIANTLALVNEIYPFLKTLVNYVRKHWSFSGTLVSKPGY